MSLSHSFSSYSLSFPHFSSTRTGLSLNADSSISFFPFRFQNSFSLLLQNFLSILSSKLSPQQLLPHYHKVSHESSQREKEGKILLELEEEQNDDPFQRSNFFPLFLFSFSEWERKSVRKIERKMKELREYFFSSYWWSNIWVAMIMMLLLQFVLPLIVFDSSNKNKNEFDFPSLKKKGEKRNGRKKKEN